MIKQGIVLLFPLLLSGCNMGSSSFRISALVLAPTLLLIGILWLLNRRGGDDNKWEEDHYPDADNDADDDDENHYLM